MTDAYDQALQKMRGDPAWTPYDTSFLDKEKNNEEILAEVRANTFPRNEQEMLAPSKNASTIEDVQQDLEYQRTIGNIPPDDSYLKGLWKYLHTPTEEAEGVFDFVNRVLPESAFKLMVGAPEFVYYGIKGFTDPIIEGVAPGFRGEELGTEETLEIGKKLLTHGFDIATGLSRFVGEPFGLYGKEDMKRRWLTDPVGALAALSPMKSMTAASLPKKVKGTLERVYDSLDIQAKFARIGSELTGIQIKNAPSISVYEQEKALQAAKLIKGDKLTAHEGYEATLRASNVIDEGDVSPRVNRAAETARQYFDGAASRLEADGALHARWPQSHINRNLLQIEELEERIGLIKSKKKKGTLRKKIQELEDINEDLISMDVQYVHIPLDTWFRKIRDTLGEQEANEVINTWSSSYFKGRFFKERKTVDIRTVINWMRELEDPQGQPIFNDLDFDVRMIMGSYAQKAGRMRSLGRIFQSAEADGLIVPKTEEVPEGYGSFSPDVTRRFPELKKSYGHNAFVEYLDNFHQKMAKGYQLGRFMGYTKIMAFYNPFFLPAYDVWQSSWLRGLRMLNVPEVISDFTQGFEHVLTKSDLYYTALEDGTFAAPYVPPFENFMRDIENTVYNKDATQVLDRLKKYSKGYPIVDDFYRTVWNMAWTGDHSIRMGTYLDLTKRGMSSAEAAQTTAYFHGDYARVTPKARKILNKVFFTPTFKYAMGHLQANMVKSSVKVMRDALLLKKPAARDLMFAKGAAALVAGLMAKDHLMEKWGFETDDLGLRYVKRTVDDKGQDKELVVYWPDPGNVMLRQVHKWTTWGDDPDRMDDFMNKAHWDLHPLWSVSFELFKNRKMNGEPIRNIFDDQSTQAKDLMHHAISRIVAAEGFVEQHIGDKGARSAYTALKKEVGWLDEKFLSAVTLAYLREPKERREAWRARKLKKLYIQAFEEDTPKNDEEAEIRLNNFFEMMNEILP